MICDHLRYTFRKWLGKRYTRHAWPDALQPRLRNVFSNTVRRRIKNSSELLEAVLIRYAPSGELNPEENYQIEIVTLMSGNNYSDPEKLEKVEEISNLICERINITNGLVLFENTEEVASAEEMTIEEFSHFVVWDFDDLSPEDDSEY